jgi:hypothetical protein
LIWASHVARMEEGRSISKFYNVHLHERNPRRRWEENIRMDLKEIGINTRNWGDSALDRDYWKALVNAVLDLWVQ